MGRRWISTARMGCHRWIYGLKSAATPSTVSPFSALGERRAISILLTSLITAALACGLLLIPVSTGNAALNTTGAGTAGATNSDFGAYDTQTIAQIPDLGLGELTRPFLETYDSGLETDWVHLDGRRVVVIAAPRAVVESGDSDDIQSPIEFRVSEIERQLRTIARDLLSNTDPILIEEVSEDNGNLAQIQVNGRYLMSITLWDAQVIGLSVSDRAKQVTRRLTVALERFRYERSSEYLQQRITIALGLLLCVALIAYVLTRLRQSLARHHERVLAQFAAPVPLPRTTPDPENAWKETVDPDHEADTAAATQEWHERREQWQMRQDLQQLLLQLLQVFIWPAAAVAIIGLFPQSRYVRTAVLDWFSGPAVQILVLALFAYILIRLSYVAINRVFTALSKGRWVAARTSSRLLKRIQTFSEVLKSILTVSISGGALLLALTILDVNVAPLLAGVGIIGLALSFGSQNLVRDVINGFLILAEDQFSVGDVIATNGVTGFVEDITLRVTWLRSGDGNLIVIPNGKIEVVENLTNGFSRANLVVEVAYDTDLDFAIKTIADTANRMAADPEWQEIIVKTPQVLGVDSFGDNSIAIRVWIDTQPLKQWSVGREFRRRLKADFDSAGISIPFPQRTIWFNSPLQTMKKSLSESELQQLLIQKEHSDQSLANE